MPEYKTHKCPEREARGRPCVSFTIDGAPTLMWWPICKEESLGWDYFARRAIKRLQAGREDSLGGMVKPVRAGFQATAEDAPRGRVFSVTTGTPTVNARGKTREAPARWKYALDGVESEKDYPTESAAREACACAGFLSRGKLGRLDAIRAAIGEGATVGVCPERHRIVARDAAGVEYAVALDGEGVRVKAKAATEEEAK